MSKKMSEDRSGVLGPNGKGSQPGYTLTQKAVAEVWAEVLEKSPIAITDNFFDLGGDSLKAMEVIARLHASLGVEIPLLAFFEDPTVAHAAEVVDSLRPEQTASLAKAKSEGPLPLSFPQLTFWLLQQSDPLGYLYIEPRVIRIAGKLRADLLQQALDTMCRRHDSMHTRFVVGEGEPSQVVVPDAHLDLPVQDLSSAPLADAERAAMAIARKLSQQSFDLS